MVVLRRLDEISERVAKLIFVFFLGGKKVRKEVAFELCVPVMLVVQLSAVSQEDCVLQC